MRVDRNTTWAQARLKVYVKRVEEVYEIASHDPEDRGIPPKSYFFDDDLLKEFWQERIESLKKRQKSPNGLPVEEEQKVSNIAGIGDR